MFDNITDTFEAWRLILIISSATVGIALIYFGLDMLKGSECKLATWLKRIIK